MHDHVHAGQAPGQRGIPDIDDAPGHAGHVAPVIVDGNHPADRADDASRTVRSWPSPRAAPVTADQRAAPAAAGRRAARPRG